LFLNGVEDLSDMLVFGLQSEVHIPDKEFVLAFLEESALVPFGKGVIVYVLDVQLPLTTRILACC
jgi:hypothetical protein